MTEARNYCVAYRSSYSEIFSRATCAFSTLCKEEKGEESKHEQRGKGMKKE